MLRSSTRRFLLHGLLWGLCLLAAAEAAAQSGRVIPLDDGAYTYIERLQRRGHLLSLQPTALPYTEGALGEALAALDADALSPTERRWVALLQGAWGAAVRPDDAEAWVAARGSAGVRATNNDRLDPLRHTEAGTPTLQAGPVRLFQHVGLDLHLDAAPFVAHVGARHDQFYWDDPDAIRSVLRIYTRNEHTYAGAYGRLAQLYVGRLNHHWGLSSGPAALLSRNPRTFDQLYYRLGDGRLSLRGLLGELDSMTDDGRFTGTAGADTVDGSRRRFVAAHRMDWRPSRKVVVTLMESAIYSGPTSGVSLKYLNPLNMHILGIDNKPKNDENNGLVAAMVWAQVRRLTLHGQLLFDDFDFLSSTGEPTAFALLGALRYAGPTPNIDLGLDVQLVAARTYNTPQPEGRYFYLQRGLAAQHNDFVHVAAQAEAYLDAWLPGLTLTPRLDLLLQGEQTPHTRYPDVTVGGILTGTVERTLRPAVQVRYQPGVHWWLQADLGVNLVDALGHVPGASESRFVGLVSVGGSLSLDRPLRFALR